MTWYDEFEPRPNRLVHAQSTYLRSAAYQPIGWYEYGPEAFADAQRQHKPILLDIGAAWCHWCHVMDHESYENPEIATLLNERFIPIKVDRDERPELDARFQTAVQLLSQQGGWPLTVFLTPDGTPFFGGTYFPPEDRRGQQGLKTLLPVIADAFAHRRDELEAVAAQVLARARAVEPPAPGAIDREVSEAILSAISRAFNPRAGGFAHTGAQFPHPAAVEFALLAWTRTHEERWQTIAALTLTAMARGGLYDQLGGGFHRYTVDTTWRIPHFEKLGTENALLLATYLHAAVLLGDELYRDIAEGTLHYLWTVLADHDRGGFFYSQDADSPAGEGAYWTWSAAEVEALLPPDERAVVLPAYGILPDGPLDGRNVLYQAETPAQLGARLHLPLPDVLARLTRGRARLWQAREERPHPGIDRSKYAAGNAIMISACLEAGTLLARPDVTAFALRSLECLLRDAYDPDQGVYHAFQTEEGARLPGIFDDQIFTVRALLDAFAVSGTAALLVTARALIDHCLEHYWDAATGGFFDTAAAQRTTGESPLQGVPRKSAEDIALPSANAVAALVLDRLWGLTHDTRYHLLAQRTLEACAARVGNTGIFAATFGQALTFHLTPPLQAIIVGDPTLPATQRLWETAVRLYRPGRAVALFAPDGLALPYPPGPDGHAVAYVCAGERCATRTEDPDELRRALETG
jgi:uncharacterized protein YyaL (SSP411 family)